jgi:uncharacterized protein (TIGR02118 family)
VGTARRIRAVGAGLPCLGLGSLSGPIEEQIMVKLVVAYGPPDDPAAFDQHYTQKHIPLVQKIPDLQRFEAGKVLGTPDGSAAPYYFIAELWFDTPERLQAARQTPEGQAAANDVDTFASGGVTLMIAEA